MARRERGLAEVLMVVADMTSRCDVPADAKASVIGRDESHKRADSDSVYACRHDTGQRDESAEPAWIAAIRISIR
jgi:hypothetical protein